MLAQIVTKITIIENYVSFVLPMLKIVIVVIFVFFSPYFLSLMVSIGVKVFFLGVSRSIFDVICCYVSVCLLLTTC